MREDGLPDPVMIQDLYLSAVLEEMRALRRALSSSPEAVGHDPGSTRRAQAEKAQAEKEEAKKPEPEPDEEDEEPDEEIRVHEPEKAPKPKRKR